MTFKAGKEHYNWKGGKTFSDGYVFINTSQDSMFGGRQQTAEHRYVMAKHLGRDLYSYEIVHHINEDKADNRIENLEMISKAEHARLHKRGVKRIADRICAYCQKSFKPHYSGSDKKFCGQKCAINWSWYSPDSNRKKVVKKTLPVQICDFCKNPFTSKTDRPGKKHRFCGHSCTAKYVNEKRYNNK